MQKLKAYMKQKNLSLCEISYDLRVPTTTIHRWLNGKCTPQLKHAMAIEAYTKGAVKLSDWLK
jgi:transcriptional regulator with XRE-family HTH domain